MIRRQAFRFICKELSAANENPLRANDRGEPFDYAGIGHGSNISSLRAAPLPDDHGQSVRHELVFEWRLNGNELSVDRRRVGMKLDVTARDDEAIHGRSSGNRVDTLRGCLD